MTLVQNPEEWFWRTDLHLGRNIYVPLSNDVTKPSEDDPLIGTMESSELAEMVVDLHNLALERFGRHFRKALASGQ